MNRLGSPPTAWRWGGIGSPSHQFRSWLRERGPLYLAAGRNVWTILNWRGFADIVALLFLAGIVLYFFRDSLLQRRVFFENDTAVFYYQIGRAHV